MDYNVTGNFAKAPLGPFTEANKRLVWPGLTGDFDKVGAKYEIVADDRFPNGRACRLFYPKGEYGMQDQSYQIRLKSPQTVANIEYLWLWEDGFSFYTDPGDGGGGKTGPCINWGEIGGEESKRGTRCMIWFNSHGSNKPHPVFNPSCQDQRSGNQLIQPVKYSKPYETNKIYKFRIQMKGGPAPDAFAKYWITYPGETTETLLAEVSGKNMMATATDDVIMDFAFFSGGASPAYSPAHDSYARHGGIRYWSGETDAGNGEPGTGGGGGDTGPTPPSGATLPSLAIGETKVFRARFFDTSVSPAQEVPAKGNVSWKLSPNNVSWGSQEGPNWSALKITGKTEGKCTLTATDAGTGITTQPVTVEVTKTSVQSADVVGTCMVEPAK